MKTRLSIVVLSLSLVGLAACSSTGAKSAYVAPQAVGQATTHKQVRDVPDAQYVAEVDWIARHRGVRVQWVNPPMKRVVVDR